MQFVDDELLRAPLPFSHVLEGTLNSVRKAMAAMGPVQHAALGELVPALRSQSTSLAEYFLHSLREQVMAELPREATHPLQRPPEATALALVDEVEVALDIALSHTIEAIKTSAEHELRELQTCTSALVGDADVSRDYNPFRAETFARALWGFSQALPLSCGHQVAFVRHAGPVLAQTLRMAYAAATSRLEDQGVEPAAFRTSIRPVGSRRGGDFGITTFSPDLHRMRDAMPTLNEQQLSIEGHAPQVRGREPWIDIARFAGSRVDRQGVELVRRLFDAMVADERVPPDISQLIARLRGPAMRLALRDGSMLDRDRHPLWRFINRLACEAEMAPDFADPERTRLLRTAQATVDQLTSEPGQNAGLYAWAIDRMESYLRKRLARRLSAAASHIGALQKLEDKLTAGHAVPSTMHGTLDIQQLDTVPAGLMADLPPTPQAADSGDDWLRQLSPGDWVRLFLQGRWVHPQLLWQGDRGEIWLFGDGASDATRAVHRGALLLMREQALLKSLKQRSIVGSAAARVQQESAAKADP